jgi:hypothetical protein
MPKARRGIIIKNTHDYLVEPALATRLLTLEPGDEVALTPDEVRDPVMRESLQFRIVSIVRPTTKEEEKAILLRKDD